jgi:hypothetical protein
MALIKLDPNKTIPYIPAVERTSSKPLTVHLKFVNRKLYLEFTDRLSKELLSVDDPQIRLKINRAHDKENLVNQIVKIENFLDENGNQITNIEDFVDSIDAATGHELVQAMQNQTLLLDGQKKT